MLTRVANGHIRVVIDKVISFLRSSYRIVKEFLSSANVPAEEKAVVREEAVVVDGGVVGGKEVTREGDHGLADGGGEGVIVVWGACEGCCSDDGVFGKMGCDVDEDTSAHAPKCESARFKNVQLR